MNISPGTGYEVTNLDVMDAYDRAMDAAAGLGKGDEVVSRISQHLESADSSAVKFVRQALAGRLVKGGNID